MKLASIVLAFGLLAVAAPLAVPAASAYCVNSICQPVCMICIIVFQEVASLRCQEATNGETTTVSCSDWITGTHAHEQDAPLPVMGPICLRQGGSYGVVSTCAMP